MAGRWLEKTSDELQNVNFLQKIFGSVCGWYVSRGWRSEKRESEGIWLIYARTDYRHTIVETSPLFWKKVVESETVEDYPLVKLG